MGNRNRSGENEGWLHIRHDWLLMEIHNEESAGLTSSTTLVTKFHGSQMLAQSTKEGQGDQRGQKSWKWQWLNFNSEKAQNKNSVWLQKKKGGYISYMPEFLVWYLYSLYKQCIFLPIEEGIKWQRNLVLVVLFYFISETPSGTGSIFGRLLLSAIRHASSSLRSCFKIWYKKRWG